MSETVYTVTGMSCDKCADAVTRAVGDRAGVGAVSVDVGTGRVTVHSDTVLPIDSVRAAIDDAGYRLITA